MRKTILITICAALAIPAAAQSWDQAQMFSENIYGGTARSIAMGNALTAVGGDLGSIGLNPAGGAVAGYSQFSITPSLSISATKAQGYASDGLDPLGFGDKVSSGYTRFKMPNVGFSINMDTGRRHGLKRVTLGFVSNSTNDYTYKMGAAGTFFGTHSYSGSLASLANGYTEAQLAPKTSDDWFADGPAWEAMAGYMSGIIDYMGDNTYLGLTDVMVGGIPEAAAELYQQYGHQAKGYKQDMVFNVSTNFNDKLYLGLNLGVTALSYTEAEYWLEKPDNASTFPKIEYDGGKVATFNSLLAKRAYGVSGSGIYLKAGVLWRPVAGLRLGAAIQTPTLVNMTGRCTWYGETNLSGISFSPSKSPEDEWIYSLRMPFRWNAGLAYSFGSFAVVSVDYEMADYSHARYRSRSEFGYSDGGWGEQNADIQDALGLGHNIRAGMEFKPIPELALRVGYNFLSGAQKNWLVWDNTDPANPVLYLERLTSKERASQASQIVSFGAGYSFGAFYTDLAVRLRFRPDSYYTPYHHYEPGASVYDKLAADYIEKAGNTEKIVPEVLVTSKGIDAVLTLGWRF